MSRSIHMYGLQQDTSTMCPLSILLILAFISHNIGNFQDLKQIE